MGWVRHKGWVSGARFRRARRARRGEGRCTGVAGAAAFVRRCAPAPLRGRTPQNWKRRGQGQSAAAGPKHEHPRAPGCAAGGHSPPCRRHPPREHDALRRRFRPRCRKGPLRTHFRGQRLSSSCMTVPPMRCKPAWPSQPTSCGEAPRAPHHQWWGTWRSLAPLFGDHLLTPTSHLPLSRAPDGSDGRSRCTEPPGRLSAAGAYIKQCTTGPVGTWWPAGVQEALGGRSLTLLICPPFPLTAACRSSESHSVTYPPKLRSSAFVAHMSTP